VSRASASPPGAAIDASGLALLAIVASGISISTYLTVSHYTRTPLACSTSGPVDCGTVVSSTYSVLPGTDVPVALLGIAWFVALGSAAAVARRARGRAGFRPAAVVQMAWALAGLLTVLYLVYVELVRLHKICEWCSAVHLLVLVAFMLSLRQLQTARGAGNGSGS
jgi:uncharacterized membrane protein